MKFGPALLRAGFACAALAAVSAAHATPEFAAKENKACSYCHVNPAGGGRRNYRGLYYQRHMLSFADFDNEYEAKMAGVKPDSDGMASIPTVDDYGQAKPPAALAFTLKDIDGNNRNLARWQGNVIMLVNTASLCGNTPQYASLETLYKKYQEKGFTILAFPANNFGMQEPGTNKDIKTFCTMKYNVTFPIFSKISVKGDDIAPLYKFLTAKETDEKFAGDIEWNFAKFLVDRQGNVVARIPAGTDPTKPEVVAAIEKELAKPKPGAQPAAPPAAGGGGGGR